MSFEPKTVIDWYKARPKWARVLLFVFVAVAVVLSVFWWGLTMVTKPSVSSKPGPLEAVTDALENEYREDVEQATEAIRQNDEEIAELHEERVIIAEQRKEGMKQNETEHKAIDGASDAGSVVVAINANRSKRRPTGGG